MNEGTPGKSARPKWWSRPRPAPQPDASGDFPLAAPGPTDPLGSDIAAPRPTGAAPSADLGHGPGPEASAAAGRGGGAVPPAPAGPAALGEAGGAGGSGGADEHAVRPEAPVAPAHPAQPGDLGGPEPSGAGSPTGSVTTPRPLHEPDHYSTPPYGNPGPWAPAPPVQHPATPAAGTHLPPQAPAPAAGDLAAPLAPAAPAPPVPAGQTAAREAWAPVAPAEPAPGPAASAPAPAPEDAVPAGPPEGRPSAAAEPAASDEADPWSRYDPWATPGTGPAPAPLPAAPLQGGGEAAESPSRRRARRRRVLVGGAALVALAAGLAGGLAGVHLERYGGLGVVELSQAPRSDTPRDPDSVAGIAERALPSVVTLHVQGSGQAGTGTGFVLDERGHILTNHHVVEAAEDSGDGRIVVTFSGGETARAELVGGDSGYDLAVVRVKGVKGLRPMPLGNSDNVRVGDPVVAIGAPFDLSNTVTAGIISAKERPITAGGEGEGGDVSYVDALQTDAPINPGNSGGPLLDAEGRVVGINSAIRSADTGIDTDEGRSGSIGLGFAIPVNQAKRVAEELINEGEATHPVIGVTLDMAYPGDGARVHTRGADGGSPVTPGGPGAEAGLKPGDVITAVDGVRVHSGDELIVKTRARRPGDRLELTVERDGEERKVSLVLGSSQD
ncbi:trypsin-like peptidase domain-containing protein [Streptomyces sp. NPDC002644]